MRDRTLLAVCAGQFLGLCAVDMGMPFLPSLLGGMGVRGDADLVLWTGWAQAAAFVLSVLVTPLWGRLGDARGRRKMLVRANFGLALALLCLAGASSPWEVVAARALQGALAGLVPAALALLAEGSDSATRLAWARSAALAGALVGPFLGGALLPLVGAAWLFRIGALLSVASGLLVWLLADEVRPPASPTAPAAAGAQWMAPGLLAVWVMGWRAVEDPVLAVYIQNLTPPGGDWALWVGVCLGAARLTALVSGPLWGRYLDRHGAERSMRAVLVGAALLTAAQALAPDPLWLAAIRALLGVFSGALVTAMYAAAVARSAPERRGEAIGYTSSGVRLGTALGNAGAGLLAAGLGLPGMFALTGASLLAAALRPTTKETA